MIFLVCAPSGTGKTTIIKKFLEENKNFSFSVSVTTRPKREKEIEGIHYFFKNEDEFFRMKENNEFIETETIFNNCYATLKSEMSKKNVIADLDINGIKTITDLYPESIIIGMLPPSLGELKKRLQVRQETNISNRLENVESQIKEISRAAHYIIVNYELNETIKNFTRILKQNESY